MDGVGRDRRRPNRRGAVGEITPRLLRTSGLHRSCFTRSNACGARRGTTVTHRSPQPLWCSGRYWRSCVASPLDSFLGLVVLAVRCGTSEFRTVSCGVRGSWRRIGHRGTRRQRARKEIVTRDGLTFPVLFSEGASVDPVAAFGSGQGVVPFNVLLDVNGFILRQKVGTVENGATGVVRWVTTDS